MKAQGNRSGGISRRRFLRGAAVGAALAAVGPFTRRAFAWQSGTSPSGRKVAVFGGGIAGLTAAHELAERGFDVTVYERRAWGGKARSTEVPDSAADGRKPLPGEHGWRTFFGFYQNLPHTMGRIPFESNPHGVFDNLAGGPQFLAARDGGRRDLVVPLGVSDPRLYTPASIFDLIVAALLELDLPADGVAHFAGRLVVFFSSCDARRHGEWENTPWTEFTRADRYSDDYRRILVNAASEVLQASKGENTSTLFPAHFLEWVVYNLLGLNSNGDIFRFLDRPTNEAFIEPWVAHLGNLGVNLALGYTVEGFDLADGRIAGATVSAPSGRERVSADWYVCALPVERARALWSPEIRSADPQLARMDSLDTGWMNGLKFFLREANRPANRGCVDYVDSPWRLTSVDQAQFWPADFASTYGDGSARDCLSAIISDWNEPGILYGKAARDCTADEIAREVWEQMKRHLNDTGSDVLTDDLVLSYDIDPGMLRVGDRLVSDDPLVLPSVGQRPDRPDVTTAIPNLVLAGDYLKSDWEVANMETANFNGRRAANAVVEQSGSRAPAVETIASYRPPEWEPLKRIDELRWRLGERNLFDAVLPPIELRALLERF